MSGVFSARARFFKYHRPSSGIAFWCLRGKKGVIGSRKGLSPGLLAELFTLAVLLANGPGQQKCWLLFQPITPQTGPGYQWRCGRGMVKRGLILLYDVVQGGEDVHVALHELHNIYF